MRGLAFAYDPSGYWIELIDRKLWPVKSILSQGILVTFLEVHDVIGVTQVICSYFFLQQRSRSLGFRFESIRENASKMPRLLIRRCFEMCFQHCF